MNYKEFKERLVKKFPKDCNSIDIEDMDNFFYNISFADFDGLYDGIVNNYDYKTFPSLKFVKERYEAVCPRNDSGKDGARVLDYCRKVKELKSKWEDWSLHNIIKKMMLVSKKISDGTAHLIDMEFHNMWAELYSEFCRVKEYEWGPQEQKVHLENVKGCIIQGRSYQPALRSGSESHVDTKRLTEFVKSV